MNVKQNLSQITNRKFIESYPGNGRKILTPSGYREILEVHKTIPYRKFRIVLENGFSLECAYNHVIITENNSEVYSKDSLGTYIKTVDGISRVSQVIDLEVEENMYDISIDSQDELYYSNGVLSHNSGKSISTGIYLCHQYNFNKELNIGIVANKGSMAREFLANVKNMFIELPMWMQQGSLVWNQGSIQNESKMRILTDVPSADSFRGYSIHILVIDENAFIRPSVWEAFSDSIFPAQSGLSWKKNISISTANGMNFFYNLVKGAREGTNGTKIFEVDWEDVPRYDTDGTIMEPEKFKDKIVKKHGIIYFEQNYGNNFMGSSHTLVGASALEKFISKEPEEIRDGKLKIYKYPEKGHQYICSVDSAKDGIDDFAVNIIDITDFKFEQVASAQLQIDYLLMPEYINDWCEYYNNPYLIIENNEGAGQSIADQMYQTYEYENLHFDKDTGTKKKKKYPGFRTTTKSRKLILQTLKLFIENNNLMIYDKKTINQFYTFILLNNKYQADENCKDDAIMALALSFAPFCNSKNFEDMKGLVERLYAEFDDSDREETDKSFIEYLSFGSFDDGVDENQEASNKTSRNYDY